MNEKRALTVYSLPVKAHFSTKFLLCKRVLKANYIV